MNPPTQTEIETAAIILGKIATADQWAAKPDTAMAITWAECFKVHNLQRPDLLEAVIRYFADDSRDKTNRTLPSDIIKPARELRRQRGEAEKTAGHKDVRKLDPARQAIELCDYCDPNGWIEINGYAHRCDHRKMLGEAS